jgi:hypothetical protein
MILIEELEMKNLKTKFLLSGKFLTEEQEILLEKDKKDLIKKAIKENKEIDFCQMGIFTINKNLLYLWFNIVNQSTKVIYKELNFEVN